MRDEFAAVEQKTISPDEGESWTGMYLTGENTYLELFAPSGVEGASVGAAGAAFGVERSGSIVSVHERLKAALSGVPDQVRICAAKATAASPNQIASLSFSLQRRVEQAIVLRLGAESELSLQNDRAEWCLDN